ncbi:hypothetical protein Q1695_013194 [Nippostrongylus brasiliensis]|nr:hypothetical protein Q1695_013194 [Nippostrongylus brasiliensis]
MPKKDVSAECGSPSNTESDRDPNVDELPAKPVDETSDEEPAAGEGLSEEVYEVEKILAHEETKEGRFYLVHWKGFTAEDDSWEPAENLACATIAIEAYEASLKSKSKKGRKSSTKTPKKSEKSSKKSTTKSPSSSTSSKKRGSRPPRASVDLSDSGPDSYVPSDVDDEEYNEKPKSTKKTPAVPPPKGSGTVTKAALKSYSPTTTKPRRDSASTSTTAPSETMSAAKKALLMRQSWLYDSDSDEDSGTEKENEKYKEVDDRVESTREQEKKEQQKEEPQKATDDTSRSGGRKRKQDDPIEEKKKKARAGKQDGNETAVTSVTENVRNGERTAPAPSASATAESTSNVSQNSEQDEVQIFAIGKVSDGRIRVLVGNDNAKKVVSLRDAHDANSWGLLQHLLQYAAFDDIDE